MSDGQPSGPDVERAAEAREKYACPACGAEAHWNPSRQALICPFCGTTSPATLETRGAATVIVEHDLVAALRNVPEESRGWQAAKLAASGLPLVQHFGAEQAKLDAPALGKLRVPLHAGALEILHVPHSPIWELLLELLGEGQPEQLGGIGCSIV